MYNKTIGCKYKTFFSKSMYLQPKIFLLFHPSPFWRRIGGGFLELEVNEWLDVRTLDLDNYPNDYYQYKCLQWHWHVCHSLSCLI